MSAKDANEGGIDGRESPSERAERALNEVEETIVRIDRRKRKRIQKDSARDKQTAERSGRGKKRP